MTVRSRGKRNGRPTAGILRMMSVPSIGLLFQAYAANIIAGTQTSGIVLRSWVAMVTALLAKRKNRSTLTDWWLPFAAGVKRI